eukprot:143819-Prorocentrum_minimum.AAC.2
MDKHMVSSFPVGTPNSRNGMAWCFLVSRTEHLLWSYLPQRPAAILEFMVLRKMSASCIVSQRTREMCQELLQQDLETRVKM